jgi:arylformamidase
MNQDLQLDAEEARRVSPLFWPVAPGRVFDAVVGSEESSEFKRQSRALEQTWYERKVETCYEEFAGNHFAVIDPLADPASAMVARLAQLAERVSGQRGFRSN